MICSGVAYRFNDILLNIVEKCYAQHKWKRFKLGREFGEFSSWNMTPLSLAMFLQASVHASHRNEQPRSSFVVMFLKIKVYQ